MRWTEITIQEAVTANQVAARSRKKIIDAMIRHVLTDRHWDRHVVDMKPELGDSQEIGDSMADSWEVERDTDFPKHVEEWANQRFDEVLTKINSVALVNGHYRVHRMMFTPTHILSSWGVLGGKTPPVPISLGVFWTFDLDNWDANSIWGQAGHHLGADILIDALVDGSSVDWETTIMANMDWFSGDEEHEMRLISKAPIDVQSIRVIESHDPKLQKGLTLGIEGKSFTA